MSAQWKGRRVLAPPVFNPYGEEKGEVVLSNNNDKRLLHAPTAAPPSRRSVRTPPCEPDAGEGASQSLPPPLPPSPVVLLAARSSASGSTASRDEAALPSAPPSRWEQTKGPRQQAGPAQPPRSRGPNSGTMMVVDVEADRASMSTSGAPRQNVLSGDTQRPRVAYSAQDSREPSARIGQPSLRSTRLEDSAPQDRPTRNGSGRESGESTRRPMSPPPEGQQQQQRHQQQKKQQFVVQSAFTQRNPFRRQTFENFCCSPDYRVPPGFSIYQDDSNVWKGYQRASESGICGQRASEDSSGGHQSLSSVYLAAGPALGVLQRGDWFLKWTRQGKVHERYVWLDAERGTLVWGPGPRPSLMLFSQLKLSRVMDLRPDCLFDQATQRTFYRLFFVTEERTIVFATEVRDKFDAWFDVLIKITSASGAPQLWGELWGTSGAEVAQKEWSSRFSPLHAVLHGYGAAAGPMANATALGGARGRVLPSD